MGDSSKIRETGMEKAILQKKKKIREVRVRRYKYKQSMRVHTGNM
jgi:hypothetical protein